MLRRIGRLILVPALLLVLVAVEAGTPFLTQAEGRADKAGRRLQHQRRPRRPRQVPCHPRRQRRDRPGANLNDPCEAAAKIAAQLQSGDTFDLALLSSSLIQTFGEENLKQAFRLGWQKMGALEAVQPGSQVEISTDGEWMTTWIKIKPQNGEELSYRVVFHREDGNWKLFGTQTE